MSENIPHNIRLGAVLRDRITLFEGVATMKVEWLTGCIQFGLSGPLKDGELRPLEHFDWQRLEYVKPGPLEAVEIERMAPDGGDTRDAPKVRGRR